MQHKIFDAHLHIIDPAFPLVKNQGFLPNPYTVDTYLAEVSPLGIKAGAVVSGSFQAFDTRYLLNALERLGPGFVGVAQLPESVSDDELIALNAKNIRAVRFNLKRGGSESINHLTSFSQRIFELVGWHVELYIDSRELNGLEKKLLSLPAISIDHLGLSKAGLPAILRLAEKGVRIKATGFGRLDFPAREALRAIHNANPHALMFGTDLPSTRAPRAFEPADIELIIDELGDGLGSEGSELVLWQNAVDFYRL